MGMYTEKPLEHDVVLVGGGHSHALVLRRWAMNPLPGVRLTLVSKDTLTPYSGMLPGYVAGHYSFEDIHIDLLQLCAWAGVRFIQTEMTGIDLDKKTLQLAGRPDIGYDVLALDTGSTPTLEIPGAKEFSTPVKPVYSFIERWLSVQDRNPKNLGVVGAGAGGFELIMAMAHRLKSSSVSLHWFLRSNQAMSDRPEKVGRLALEKAAAAGVTVHREFDVSKVTEGQVHSVDGKVQAFDDLLWCTAASSPAWPAAAGLATDSRGFVATKETLQSVSHPDVFATGDIGTQINTPSVKAGVFAVRQAPVLFHNLRALVSDKPLKPYVPQKDFLSLVSAGDKYAIGSRSGFSFSGGWVWKWKHSIDKAFMDKFHHLPTLNMKPVNRGSVNKAEPMRCNGCGAKVPAEILNEVVQSLHIENTRAVHIHSGVQQGDDAAVVDWPSTQLVQSVDQLRALVNDPYVFGRISALHALSDIYAQQAQAHSAQVLITLPFAKPNLVKRELTQLMLGIVGALNEEQCVLLGGHTAEGQELQVGLVVNATQPLANESPHNTQPKQHDRYSVILTKPLGVGVLFAGLMQAQTKGVHVDAAVQQMVQSNAAAASIFKQHNMSVCTDITGFGLLGHLQSLAVREHVSLELTVSQVPLLEGVQELADQGVQSSLSAANRLILEQIPSSGDLSNSQQIILTDPQTSGGLAALVPIEQEQSCVEALRETGFHQACAIGHALYVCDDPAIAGIVSLR